MTTATVVLVIATVAVVLGVMKKLHHGFVAFAAVVMGISLMHSALAAPANGVVNAMVSLVTGLLHAFGISNV
ncbi:MAG: hypothetical protein ACRDRN_16985 [Sciscionella sp.]